MSSTSPIESTDVAVIGAGPIAPAWYAAQPPPLGRYGTSHLNDVWGFSRLACVDY